MNQIEEFQKSANYRNGKFVFNWVKGKNPLASADKKDTFTGNSDRGIYFIKWNVGARTYELYYNGIVIRKDSTIVALKGQARKHYDRDALS